MKSRILLTLTAALLLSAVSTTLGAADSVSISTIEGQISPGVVRAETPLRFYVRFLIDSVPLVALNNGFRLYSPDGATWQPPSLDTLNSSLWALFGTGVGTEGFSVDGMGADSVILIGIGNPFAGFPGGTDDSVAVITTRVGEEWIGHTLCIDSSFLPPGHDWDWRMGDGRFVTPKWGGPYCFTIASCCQGMAGNVDNDPNDEITVSDLTYMVERGFLGGPDYECPGEADVNGDGDVSPFIPDLTYLVTYLFQGGPPPAACQ